MKNLLILILITACAPDYKCVNNEVYKNIGGGSKSHAVYVKSITMFERGRCLSDKEKEN